MKKLSALLLALLIMVAMLLGACGPTAVPTEAAAAPTEAEAPAPTEAEPEPEPTEPPPTEPPPTEVPEDEPVLLRVGIFEDVDCWNPYVCLSFFYYGHHTTEGFAEHGPASTGCAGVPRQAESWEVSNDGRT